VKVNRAKTCICLLLFLVTLAIFWQTGHHEFVNYDDPHYITNNPQVKAGLTWQGVRWAFTTTHASNWHPLTWLSHMADVELFGLQPRGHHMTSVLLHGVNALLLFLFLARASGALWPSAFAAAIFAFHPLRVQSVAWVAERKDVLSLMFGLLALFAYIRYVTRPTVNRYLLVFILLALSLLAKPMLVTLPFVMLLLDYWPFSRFPVPDAEKNAERYRYRFLGLSGGEALLVEKLPLIALALASSVATIYAQQSGAAIVTIHSFPLLARIENAVVAYVRYLGKMAFPVDLAVFYPLQELSFWKVGGAALLLVAITGSVLVHARRQPYLVTGWFWFLGTMVPVIGLVQVGMQAMADRYTYFPMIGIAVILAWGGSALAHRLPVFRYVLVTAALLLLIGLTTLSWRQLAHWQNSFTLFSHDIQVTDNNFIALGYLGLTLHDQMRYQEAVKYYKLSLCVNSMQEEMHHNLGLAYRDLGEHAAAERQFKQLLKINPSLAETRYELALLLAGRNETTAAIGELKEVVRLIPDHIDAHYNLGVAYIRQGLIKPAIWHFSEVLRLDPGHAGARRNLERCRLTLEAGDKHTTGP